MDPNADQVTVARSVQAAGAGRSVRKAASPDDLAPVLAELLADGAHRSAAAALGDAVRAMPGDVLGADAVEAALSRAPAA
jgi:UDP:flavonoid glycosyltransferase YjiC (YdhE family)